MAMKNDSKVKQVIILRKDLKNLKKGKSVAQGAHASLAALFNNIDKSSDKWILELDEELLEWFKNRFTKVCLSCSSEKELLDLYEECKKKQLRVSLIKDAGFTAFKEPTYTAIAIGPHWNEIIDDITEHLKLF